MFYSKNGGDSCFMILLPKLPHKVQFLLNFSFPLVRKLTRKTERGLFVGGRKGYDKETLFVWLLIKKVTNWDYRTIASMAGVSHPTLIRANELFLKRRIYEKVFAHLISKAKRKGLIEGRFIALDSSFVHTFSKRGEVGSENWNEFKQAYGFKLHLLVDAVTQFPIAISLTNGVASDNTLAIPLMEKAKRFLKKAGYILADKGYDDQKVVNWIMRQTQAKAGIPMRRKDIRAKGKTNRYGNLLNWQLKARGRTFKKSIYNKRTAVERVFALLKRTYHLGKEETRGILNFAKNVYLSLICYILKLFDIAKSI